MSDAPSYFVLHFPIKSDSLKFVGNGGQFTFCAVSGFGELGVETTHADKANKASKSTAVLLIIAPPMKGYSSCSLQFSECPTMVDILASSILIMDSLRQPLSR